MERLRIGIDLDNTLINYDHVFVSAAKSQGLIDADYHGSKKDLRDSIRKGPDGETQWMTLQGRVYGAQILEATLFDGAGAFLRRCRDEGCAVYIVSHKTEFGHFDAARINLRDAARRWLQAQGFFDQAGFAVDPQNVFFAATREQKCQRIAALKPAHFIDDLEEVFLEPSFPGDVERHLFQPGGQAKAGKPYSVHPSWAEIENVIFATS